MAHSQAKPETDALIAEVMERHHPELYNAGVTILCQMFCSPKGLRLHGVPCYATVKIVSEKDRAAGMADARITIDLPTWDHMPGPSRRAVIDHGLQHLEVVYDKKTSEVKEDDAGRPRLKMRPHDVDLGWFEVVAKRHGAASIEVQQAAKLADSRGQLLFPWMAKVEPLAIAPESAVA
jgi:hypothetical protein